MNGKKIRKIITRFPNLECGFFAALLMYCENVCRHLNVTTGKLLWEFVSTASKIVEPDNDPETVYFNVGKSRFDQHGKPENRSLCQMCSLDLVRGAYDFLAKRPWLREIYALVRANDIRGERISRHQFNLRELMTALSFTHRDEPQTVLDWLALAFCGVFERCKAGESIELVFDPEQIKVGVFAYCPEKSPWFDEIMDEAVKTVKLHWSWANKAVRSARQNGRQARIFVPALNQEIDVLEVWCDSFKTGSAGRNAGYQIVIQWNTDGHCQIHGGCVSEVIDGEKVREWLHLGKVAAKLRHLEATFSGRGIKVGQDWMATDFIKFADGANIPWYLPEFLTSLYNGTMSSRDVKTTKIGKRKVFDAVCRALPECDTVVQVGNGDRRIVELASC